MKKFFTLFVLLVSATALLAQNPYVNAAKTGLANSFDTEADVINDYMAVGHNWNQINTEGDTSSITWLEEGALKVETKYDWDWGMAKFLVSPDLTETIDITNNVHVTFKYKNLAPDGCALVASFRNISDATGDELLYGGEIWLESEDLVYESDEWQTIDMDFLIEDINIDKVVLLQIGFDSGEQGTHGTVTIDDVVFGDYSVSTNPYVNAAGTGLANSFDTEEDVINDFMAVGHNWNEINTSGDTSSITWLEGGAMKIETKYDWDWGMAKFLVSPDLTETIDITNNVHITFKYKNLTPSGCALVASFRNISDATGDELLYGGEVWLEGEDLVYESDEWQTIDEDFLIEDINIDKVVLLQIGFDSGEQGTQGSVTIDDVVFGDYVVSTEEIKGIGPSVIKVYPNPAYDFVTISNAGLTFSVNIYNTIGQSVLSTTNQTQIDISSLQNGLYFIEVLNDSSREVHKILVK